MSLSGGITGIGYPTTTFVGLSGQDFGRDTVVPGFNGDNANAIDVAVAAGVPDVPNNKFPAWGFLGGMLFLVAFRVALELLDDVVT